VSVRRSAVFLRRVVLDHADEEVVGGSRVQPRELLGGRTELLADHVEAADVDVRAMTGVKVWESPLRIPALLMD